MNSDARDAQQQVDPMDFACRFFKARGGVVESRGAIKHVLLPQDLAHTLDTEELIQVGPEESPGKGADGSKVYPVQFQTPLVDRMASLAGAVPPFAQADLLFDYIKTQGFDRLIAEQFELHKAKIRVTETGEARTRYLVLTCRFRAQSDELKQGLLDMIVNLDTGAIIPDMAPLLEYVQKKFPGAPATGCTPEEIEKVHGLVSQYGPDLIEDRLNSFVKSMNRRFKRDAASLEEYYGALEKEMKAGLARTGLSERLIQEREEKIAMIPKELAAKKKDLLNKYSIAIDFKPVAALALSSPCVTVFATLIAGRQKTRMTLTYNPVTKKMDPVTCRSCGVTTFRFGCCPDLHVICPSCMDQGCRLC